MNEEKGEERREEDVDWKALLKAQGESGLSVAEYCREHGLKDYQFYYRLKRERAGLEPKGFVELQRMGESGIRLRWERLDIELSADFEEQTLGRVLRALRGP